MNTIAISVFNNLRAICDICLAIIIIIIIIG